PSVEGPCRLGWGCRYRRTPPPAGSDAPRRWSRVRGDAGAQRFLVSAEAPRSLCQPELEGRPCALGSGLAVLPSPTLLLESELFGQCAARSRPRPVGNKNVGADPACRLAVVEADWEATGSTGPTGRPARTIGITREGSTSARAR